MIIIVANLAWEPVFSYPLLTQQQYVSPRDILPGTHSPQLTLDRCCLGMYPVGEGFWENLQPCTVLKYSFYLLSNWLKSVYCPAKTSEGGGLFLPPFWCLCQKLSYSFTLVNSLLHKALNDWDCVFDPRVKVSLNTMNLTPATVRYHSAYQLNKQDGNIQFDILLSQFWTSLLLHVWFELLLLQLHTDFPGARWSSLVFPSL